MTEGYLIINSNKDNVVEVNLLIQSIRNIDPTRSIGVVVNSEDLKFIDADNVVCVNDSNPTVEFFKSLLASPYTKTIALLPNQLLTSFNTNIWENLRSINSIVLPENRYAYNNKIIDPSLYGLSQTEIKSFNLTSIPNAIYFNKEHDCDYVFGLAIVLSSNYVQNDYIEFFVDKEHSMPPFPDFIWPSWMLSFLQSITDEKISTFDFMHCIDLSIQENNFINNNWTRRWSEFLTYWVNDQGVLKIENFVQHGLIKYDSSAWLTEETLENLKNAWKI
jgi:hypothetical protein